MGSIGMPCGADGAVKYSVPQESRRIFEEGILSNPLIAKDLPEGTADFARSVNFVGSDAPSIPINWRFTESAASLKGLEAAVVAQLVKRKYGKTVSSATINTDHASLFLMSTLLWTMTTDTGEVISYKDTGRKSFDKLIPNFDLHRQASSYHRVAATNIYRTKDGRFFHLHGSMNPDPTLDSIGLPHERDNATIEDSWKPFIEKLSQIDSAEMQRLASDVYKQAGVIAETLDSFRASEHGRANAHVGLFEIHEAPNASQPAGWWPSTPQTSASRPLAGLKVVDLTRVIAAPAVTRGLAELGASVMRVTSANLVDFSALHIDLNWGKWNSHADLKTEEGRALLRALIRDADVVVQGYRPGVLDKYGFSQEGIIELCKDRARGIISVRENCYGWNGPWAYRSGWQQISDACVGISWAFGRAMGLQDGEAVTPVFPNSDYMTGIAGVCGILTALMRRGEKGGSYKVDVALNYYNQWLANSVGEYTGETWETLWGRNGREVFRSYHGMTYTIPRVLDMIQKNSGDVVFNPKFFEDRDSKALGVKIRTVKPIINFDGGEIDLGFNVGTRGNGKDQPRWPDDLLSEVVE
ncbi:hypothetical protein H2201_003201 [Coniosporium apollinis]|uniref:Uncharacterized protein n=2 Tax=Coniosporium TaxID=2810619 RepID=A0ABQ9NWM8_9PEZI|nr:hypothetical protein H2199_008546 [Cladosporium sp. JES 115]KAJ9666797.1 hypothetical protein H2201_003201 [Coniosporium apollinis]